LAVQKLKYKQLTGLKPSKVNIITRACTFKVHDTLYLPLVYYLINDNKSNENSYVKSIIIKPEKGDTDKVIERVCRLIHPRITNSISLNDSITLVNPAIVSYRNYEDNIIPRTDYDTSIYIGLGPLDLLYKWRYDTEFKDNDSLVTYLRESVDNLKYFLEYICSSSFENLLEHIDHKLNFTKNSISLSSSSLMKYRKYKDVIDDFDPRDYQLTEDEHDRLTKILISCDNKKFRNTSITTGQVQFKGASIRVPTLATAKIGFFPVPRNTLLSYAKMFNKLDYIFNQCDMKLIMSI